MTSPARSHSRRSRNPLGSSSCQPAITWVGVHRTARAGRHSSTPSDHCTLTITSTLPIGFTGTRAGCSRFTTLRDGSTPDPILERLFGV